MNHRDALIARLALERAGYFTRLHQDDGRGWWLDVHSGRGRNRTQVCDARGAEQLIERRAALIRARQLTLGETP